MKDTKATLQRWFDKAVAGLAKQGFRRSGAANSERKGDFGCLYHGDGGMKCAVGHLLRDGEVDEGVMPGDDSFTIRGKRPTGRQVDFLFDLQEAHDDSLAPRHMQAGLCAVARKYRLKLPAVLQPEKGEANE